MHLDHLTIRSHDIETSRNFFLSVFEDLKERPRPKEIARRIPGYWLYVDDKPIVHIIAGGRGHSVPSAIDHVGIHMNDLKSFRARLDRLGIQYSQMDLPELNERRIFFHTPEGALLETVFNETLPQKGSVQ